MVYWGERKGRKEPGVSRKDKDASTGRKRSAKTKALYFHRAVPEGGAGGRRAQQRSSSNRLLVDVVTEGRSLVRGVGVAGFTRHGISCSLHRQKQSLLPKPSKAGWSMASPEQNAGYAGMPLSATCPRIQGNGWDALTGTLSSCRHLPVPEQI